MKWQVTFEVGVTSHHQPSSSTSSLSRGIARTRRVRSPFRGSTHKEKKNTRCATTVNNKKATTATQGTNKQWSRVFKCTTGCATSPRRQRWSPRQGALSVQRGKDGGHDWRAYCSSEELCYHLKQPPFSNIYWSLLAHNNATA